MNRCRIRIFLLTNAAYGLLYAMPLFAFIVVLAVEYNFIELLWCFGCSSGMGQKLRRHKWFNGWQVLKRCCCALGIVVWKQSNTFSKFRGTEFWNIATDNLFYNFDGAETFPIPSQHVSLTWSTKCTWIGPTGHGQNVRTAQGSKWPTHDISQKPQTPHKASL